MKTKYLLLILLMAFTTVAEGQGLKGLSGTFNFGLVSAPNAPGLLNATAPWGLGNFQELFWGFGGDVYYRSGRRITGLDGFIATQNWHNMGTINANAYTGGLRAKLGWIVIDGGQYWIYPSLGFGMDLLSLHTNNEAYADPLGNTNYNLYTPIFDLGLNTDYMVIKRPGGDKAWGSRTLGLRAGYSLSPDYASWKTADRENSAKYLRYAHRLLYLKVTVGMSGLIEQE